MNTIIHDHSFRVHLLKVGQWKKYILNYGFILLKKDDECGRWSCHYGQNTIRNLQIFILLMQLQLVNRKLKIEVSKRMFDCAADETN